MKKYEVGMNIYIELPKGKENYVMRKIVLRAIRKGRYKGRIITSEVIYFLEVEQLYLTKPELVFRALFANTGIQTFTMEEV